MKTLKLLLATLFIATSTFAQISDKIVYTSLEESLVVADENNTYTVKEFEITEEITSIRLEPEDRYKLNQDFIISPTKVSKEISLDFNGDTAYDKIVNLRYNKPKTVNLDFDLSAGGIEISTNNKYIKVKNITDQSPILFKYINNKIEKEGIYTVNLSNGEIIEIEITNYNLMK